MQDSFFFDHANRMVYVPQGEEGSGDPKVSPHQPTDTRNVPDLVAKHSNTFLLMYFIFRISQPAVLGKEL